MRQLLAHRLGLPLVFLSLTALQCPSYAQRAPITFTALGQAYAQACASNPNPEPGALLTWVTQNAPGAGTAAVEIATALAVTADFVISNWEAIGPGVQYGLTMARAGAAAAPAASYAFGSALPAAVPIAVGVLGLGLGVIALNQAQNQAIRAGGAANAFNFQIVQGLGVGKLRGQITINGIQYQPVNHVALILPALSNSELVYIDTPNAENVGEELLQRYITQAFTAIATGLPRDRFLALHLLKHIVERAND